MMTAIFHNIFPRLSIQSDTVLAVGSVCVSIYFCIQCAAPLSGAGLNPTLALINLPFVAIAQDDSSLMKYLPSYFFGPLLAGALAGLFCKYFVMRHVPHYYDTILTAMKEEAAVKIVRRGTTMALKENASIKYVVPEFPTGEGVEDSS